MASGLEQAVFAARVAWRPEMMQSVELVEEPFPAQPGLPVSPRLDFLPQGVVPWAQEALAALALFAAAGPQRKALRLAEENRREKPVLALRGQAWCVRVRAVRLVSPLLQLARARRWQTQAVS